MIDQLFATAPRQSKIVVVGVVSKWMRLVRSLPSIKSYRCSTYLVTRLQNSSETLTLWGQGSSTWRGSSPIR